LLIVIWLLARAVWGYYIKKNRIAKENKIYKGILEQRMRMAGIEDIDLSDQDVMKQR